MMKQVDFEAFIMGLPNVQREENFGYSLFFVGDDRSLPFVTIIDSDNDYDNVSNLNRKDVFRLNIGVSKETFNNLITGPLDGDIDYSVLNVFLPHPHYSRQHFVCILNPDGENVEKTKQLIVEAHSIAEERLHRKDRS
ncbi:DUF6194 family protein [Saccharococcus caldoxylosilyticus]|jgi:hypothetical protein|uniref:DUF6194 domain-containing protein n=2 Tax=Anoxybacillaceae TaxID=3120669 RepID=A0A150M454_9BACL|nr:DUF6194 family protein [Parageobacillus caldoxylosilyticus]KYD19387.1 hypothetical protein B4119_4013 [Parageobacillus caldoxylosilyticus]